MIWSVVLIHLTGYKIQVSLSREPVLSQSRFSSVTLSSFHLTPTLVMLPFELAL